MFDSFFINGVIPVNAERGVYVPFLVVVSYLVASFGSYTGLTFAASMIESADRRIKNLLHAGGAFAFGSGIWSMHFVGMLSYRMNMVVDYDPLLTIASMLIAVLIAYLVLAIARLGRFSLRTLVLGAPLLGTAICAMHYTGMAAMRMDADLRYEPNLFLLSVLIAITASGAALWIIFSLERFAGKIRLMLKILAALIMGAAICGMHYTGMAASVIVPFAQCRRDTHQNFDTLALAVTVVTSVIFVMTLVFYLVVQERAAALQKKDYPFPVRLLALTTVFTFASIFWASGSSFYINHRMGDDISKDMAISQMGDKIGYLDTVMSKDLKMAVITGDPKWEDSYKENLRLSNQTFGELEAATSDKNANVDQEELEAYHLAQRLDRNADFFLSALENKVFDLVHAGQRDEARALLDGPEYTSRKQDYSEDVEKLSKITTNILAHTLSSLARTIFYTLYIGVTVIITLPVTWYFAFRSIRQWRGELERTRQTLVANEKQLQQFIGEIEMSRTEAIKAKEATEKEARTVTFLRNVSVTANKISNINDAIESTLKLICEYLDCPVGHAYMFEKETNFLRSAGLWFVKDKDAFRGFVQISQILPFKPGVGLPGRVLVSQVPAWIPDLSKDTNFPRRAMLPDPDVIKSGFALPLIVQQKVVYVLEFFFPQITEKNDAVLHIVQEASHQLVHVIERAQAEESLKKAKESAEKANTSKSEFLANMSHELRTPLNSILGMLRLLKEAKLPKEEYDMAEVAFRSSTNLLNIVNDILDLSKIEAGAVNLEHIGMDLNYALKGVTLTLYPIAKEKRLSLTWLNENQKIPYVLGDPTRFARVVTNLVGNAIKYTHEGRVDLRTSFKKVDDTHIEFRCEVADTGIGIPKEKQQSIFDKFTQADTSTTRQYGGTGLGLAITKQLVELMGGSIGVESEVGTGSLFWFVVPFEVTDRLNQEKQIRKSKRTTGTIPSEKARILVAEDQLLNQVLIKKLLKKFDIGVCEVVSNGVEAVKAYREGAWDAILMDCHMPEKNGYDTTREIRNLEKETGAHVPIIAMTANAMSGDKEECLRCGMDEYASKPINIDELKEILGQWILFSDLVSSQKK
jgi:signal transduction histidine kinase/NO-binding membrane sensor protein with MHYT domain/ActR/RegA family two-component response regulator